MKTEAAHTLSTPIRDQVHKAYKYWLKIILFAVACAGLNARAATAQTSPWLVNSILSESVGGQKFRSISCLTEDPVTGELYVVDNGRHEVDIIDSAGIPRYSFVHWVTDPQTGQRVAGEPHALVITPHGEILITDYFSRSIDILNIRGERTGQIDVLSDIGWNDPSLRPEQLALDGEGRLYVSIAGSRSGVARCLTDGSSCELLVDASAEGVQAITGMNVAEDGRFAVLDYRGEPAVRVYDPTGKQLIGFGGHEVSEGDLSYPTAFLFAADGSFWIADALRHAVKHYGATGTFLEYVGGYGTRPGDLRYPTAVTGDGVGRLLVSERVGGRIQEYILPGADYAHVAPKPGTSTGSVAASPEIGH
jgi:hypothetical protein